MRAHPQVPFGDRPPPAKQKHHLTSRTALVTGAGRGLGQAISRRLAELGAQVVLGDVDAGALDETVYLDKIRAAGFERVDVQSRDQTELDETTGWDDVQAILSGDDGRDAMEHLAQQGLSPADLASKIASIKVTAYKKPG